jgi:hypothetical protein
MTKPVGTEIDTDPSACTIVCADDQVLLAEKNVYRKGILVRTKVGVTEHEVGK